LGEVGDAFEGDGGEQAAGEFLVVERGVAERRAVRATELGLREDGPAVAAEGVAGRGRGEERDRLEGGDDLLLLGDGREREAAGRVRVAEADDVEEELLLGGRLDRLVVAQAVALDRPRADGAPGRKRRQESRGEEATATGKPRHGHRLRGGSLCRLD